MSAAPRLRAFRIGYYVVLLALAIRLLVPAIALAFAPIATQAFAASGLPAWLRPALAGPEIGGALLVIIPSTFWWGAGLLGVDLAGALAVHAYLRRLPWTIVLDLAVLGLLAALRRRVAAPRTP